MTQLDEINMLNEELEFEDTLKGRYLVFLIGDEEFAMEIRCITEIIGIQSITKVPQMPDYIIGITNLRGSIIPVMDARIRFKKPPKEYTDRTCIVVIDTDNISIGLVVDSVSEVLTLTEENIAQPPKVGGEAGKYIKGIGKAGDTVKLILDSKELLADTRV